LPTTSPLRHTRGHGRLRPSFRWERSNRPDPPRGAHLGDREGLSHDPATDDFSIQRCGGAKTPQIKTVEGITKTILDLTSSHLFEPASRTELEDVLTSRDPVRLVTTRNLFKTAPLALLHFEVEEWQGVGCPDSFARMLFRGSYRKARGTLAAVKRFTSGQGEETLEGILSSIGQDASSVIFHGTQGGLVLTTSSGAANLTERLKVGFRSLTGGMELSIVSEPLWPDEALLGRSPDLVRPPRFGALMEALEKQRTKAREHRPFHGLPSIPGFIQRCQECGVWPASIQINGSGRHENPEIESAASTDHRPSERSKGRFLCEGCKRQCDRTSLLENEGELEPLAEAIGVEEIAPTDRDGATTHIAVLAAALDGIWPLVTGLGGLDQVAMTHRAISDAVERATIGLAERLGLRRRHQRYKLGVGSVVLVLPASRALDGVRRLIEGTETLLSQEADLLTGYPEIQEGLRRLRFKAGLCFAPAYYSPQMVVEMAFALQDSAYRHGLREDPAQGSVSTVDFWVLHDGETFSLAVDELRRNVYESKRELRLSRRPYTFPEFKREILDVFRVFRRIPRAEAVEMRRLLLSDLRASDINFRYQMARSEDWRTFAAEAVGRDPSRWENVLFQSGPDGVKETGFLDLVELTEFCD